MGQYYYGVILDRETGAIKGACHEGKLTESSTYDFLFFCDALSKEGGYYKQRVVWAGDYSKNLNHQDKNIYDQIYEDEKGAKTIPPVKSFLNKKKEFLTVLGYLCNHTLQEYINVNEEFKRSKQNELNDLNTLALLCCDPTCRCLGGGDYYVRDGFYDVSRWCGHILSLETTVPEGYREFKPVFSNEGKPVWVEQNLAKAMFGKDRSFLFMNFINHLNNKYGNVNWRTKEIIDLKDDFKDFLSNIDEAKINETIKRYKAEIRKNGGKGTDKIQITDETESPVGRPKINFEGLTIFPVYKNGKYTLGNIDFIYHEEIVYIKKKGGFGLSDEEKKELEEFLEITK